FWTAFACCERVTNAQSAYLGSLSALLAGPAVFYMFFSPTMAHAISLGLVGLLTWRWLRCWQDGTQGIFWLGLLVGTIACVRYQNVVFGMMVAALVARDARQYGVRVGLREAALAAAGVLIPVSLQAFHYIVMNGWSLGYRAHGSFMLFNQVGIDVGSPLVTAVLFSCNKGAFYWAPVMAVGFVGLIYGAYRHAWARVVLATFIADVLLISLTRHYADTFDMGISFGMRYLTECSVVVAMGLATLVAEARSTNRWRSSVVLAMLLSGWNLSLILAYVLTIPRAGCVTYMEMASGMVRAVTQVVGRLCGS